MRVSEFYGLGLGQAALDFVNVDVEGDDPLFVDPRALRIADDPWSRDCVSLIQSFFDAVVGAIRGGDDDRAISLLAQLREPNETHLGLSREHARGMALGPGTAAEIWEALLKSEAIQTGLIADLEETALMIPGIANDRISDVTTNLIRGPLIAYTQAMCEHHEIPVENQDSGPLWDARDEQWFNRFEELPRTPRGRLVLVPRLIVRRGLHMNYDEYFRHYVLVHLQEEEIAAGTALVETLRDGRKRVTKKVLQAKYGQGKHVAERITHRYPEILANYRSRKDREPTAPLSHEELLAEEAQYEEVEWTALLDAVTGLPTGQETADDYHRAVQALLTALFGPYFAYPQREFKIHDGRKRVDITFTNAAVGGFFEWVGRHYPASLIMFECKNVGREVANPELDQMAGRFSPSRGRVGIIVCRAFEDKDRFMNRCRDTVHDDRGFIFPLDDDDLEKLVDLRRQTDLAGMWAFLRERFEFLLT